MPHPVKDAAVNLMRLTGAILRGTGKVAVNAIDVALVCSAVGALRRAKMRGVLKTAVKSAQRAVGEIVTNIMRPQTQDSIGEVLIKCFIVIPVMTPVFLVVGNMAFVFEMGAGTINVAGPPGVVAFAGMKYLAFKDPKQREKIGKLMLLTRLVGIAAPCAMMLDGKMDKLFDEVAEEIREEDEAARLQREEETARLQREARERETRGDVGGDGAEPAA